MLQVFFPSGFMVHLQHLELRLWRALRREEKKCEQNYSNSNSKYFKCLVSLGSLLRTVSWKCTIHPCFAGTNQLNPVVAVPTGSSSRGGDVTVYVWHKLIVLPFLFCCCCCNSLLLSISVLRALSNGFHSINSSDNSPILTLFLFLHYSSYWSFQQYISLGKSPSVLV